MLDERPVYLLARVKDAERRKLLMILAATTTGPLHGSGATSVMAGAVTVLLALVWALGG